MPMCGANFEVGILGGVLDVLGAGVGLRLWTGVWAGVWAGEESRWQEPGGELCVGLEIVSD